MKKTLLLFVALLIHAGCNTITDAQWQQTCETARNTVNQKRDYETLSLSCDSLTITTTGKTKLTISNTLEPITVIPRSPEPVREFMDGAGKIANTAALGLIGYKAVSGLNGQTTTSTTKTITPTP